VAAATLAEAGGAPLAQLGAAPLEEASGEVHLAVIAGAQGARYIVADQPEVIAGGLTITEAATTMGDPASTWDSVIHTTATMAMAPITDMDTDTIPILTATIPVLTATIPMRIHRIRYRPTQITVIRTHPQTVILRRHLNTNRSRKPAPGPVNPITTI
jgi:hypothetical protein